MAELELKIKNAIDQGYNHVYCMIDLDNKKEGKNKSDYVNLKKKYHRKHISKPKKGIDCRIEFFETERCTELFFLYYFKYTTKLYNHSNEVEADLSKECGYAKTTDFFRRHPLHQFFTRQGGSIYDAISNAEKSMATAEDRGYTFSELEGCLRCWGLKGPLSENRVKLERVYYPIIAYRNFAELAV